MAFRVKHTSVTVVIPAFNEEANVAHLVRQVLAEPWTDNLVLDELIVVDDCSEDATPAIAEGLAREHDRVRVIHHTARQGKIAGIRDGLAACKSDIYVNVDADVALEPGSLIKTVQLLVDNPQLAASSCVNEPLPARSWRERASRFQALLIAEGHRLGQHSLLRVYAIRMHAIAGLALPDAVADDLYIMRWLRHTGHDYAVCVDATVYMRAASGLSDFAKQTVRSWQALQDPEHALPVLSPSVDSPAGRRVTRRAVSRAVRREPLGFLLYVLWRGIIKVTPVARWLPEVTLSNHNVSTTTKDLSP